MRRPAPVDLMLIATVVIWAFNITVTKYVLTHGFKPLAYASIRYGAAALLFGALTIALERTLRVGGGRSLLLLGAAAVVRAFPSQRFQDGLPQRVAGRGQVRPHIPGAVRITAQRDVAVGAVHPVRGQGAVRVQEPQDPGCRLASARLSWLTP